MIAPAPALFTRTSSLPQRSITSEIVREASSGWDVSATMASILGWSSQLLQDVQPVYRDQYVSPMVAN